jgi:hypothetical protein
MKVVVADHVITFPQGGDQFIMQVLLKQNFPSDIVLCLNRVQVYLQLLFMSDILTASGHKINPEVLLHCPPGKAWSSMMWPAEQPTVSDFLLWRNTMFSICPSRTRNPRLGRFIAPTHKIWQWTWSKDDASLHHLKKDGVTEDVFVSRKMPNRFHYSHSQLRSHHNTICSVKPTLGNGSWCLTSLATCANPPPSP